MKITGYQCYKVPPKMVVLKNRDGAGAEVIITSNLDQEVVTDCVEQEVDIWPGVMKSSSL